MKTQRRFPFIPLLIVVALAGGGLYWWFSHNTDNTATRTTQTRGKGGRPLAPVQAADAIIRSVPRYLSGLGTVTAANTVTVRSRVDGNLIALHFTEGQKVKAGQLLAEIDPRPWQVAVTQAEGQLAKDQATLANARRDLARYEKLAKTNLVSQQELDTQRSLISEMLGTIKADEGSVASAKLNLDYSRITAPISGRVGLKQVDIGNYISSGGSSDGIVVITQIHPIDVIFSLPENTITDILHAQKAGPVTVDVWDRNNTAVLAKGELLSMDNQIDTTTGTVKLKARFSNDDDQLFPNQFVNVQLKVATLQDAVVIPAAALQMSSEGHFVWVIDSDNKVSKKTVAVGMQDSKQVVISGGLSAGERVVTDGLDRLTEGAVVDVVTPQETPVTANRPLPQKEGAHN